MFFLLLLLIINQNVFLYKILLIHKFDAFLFFIAKDTNGDGILFFNFWIVSDFDCRFYVYKIKSLCKIFVSFCDFS